MGKSAHTPAILFIILLQVVYRSEGDARVQVMGLYCDVGINTETTFVQKFVSVMQTLYTQLQSSLNASAAAGTGLDRNYGLVQCYGDLTLLECQLCYDHMRVVLHCYPTTGGRIYSDGCFMRIQNYSFFEEYTGTNDTVVCGNTSMKSSVFQELTNRTVMNAVTNALRNKDYFAREEVTNGGANDSVYVLAQCWKTLSPTSCKACLVNASVSMTTCLPWSEGHALNTGCFMRYSDTNFLNPVPASSNKEGKITAIVVSATSSAVIFTVVIMIVIYIRKCGYIQQRRKDTYDVEKLATLLRDISLNFKYSTIEKATGNWDESNKLGQGGFGVVYKGVLFDGREIAVKRLFLNNNLRVADFYNEVNMISSVEHKNLVRLLGCSCSGPESFLVYEYYPTRASTATFLMK